MKILGSNLHTSFGDCWKIVSLACNLSERGETSIAVGNASQRVQTLFKEISAVLDGGDKISIFDRCDCHVNINQFIPTVKTKFRWQKGTSHRRICYQFDGAYRSELKNPPVAHIDLFKAKLGSVEAICLGKHLSVSECVRHASTSDCFVGVDSGMAQLCYSVGVPVYLLRYKQEQATIDAWHGDKPTRICLDIEEFLEIWNSW